MDARATDGGLVATVPLRSLADGKRRLQSRLNGDERERLITRLCAAVVEALRASHVVDAIALVSADEAALRFAQTLGVTPLREEEAGLNGALRTAGQWALDAGAAAHLIVLPDLPLLQAEDVRAVVRRGDTRPGVVICPDRFRSGTNLLLLRPCHAIATQFGTRSFEAHQAAARSAGCHVAIYDAPGTGWDIDTPEDLEGLGFSIRRAALQREF